MLNRYDIKYDMLQLIAVFRLIQKLDITAFCITGKFYDCCCLEFGLLKRLNLLDSCLCGLVRFSICIIFSF